MRNKLTPKFNTDILTELKQLPGAEAKSLSYPIDVYPQQIQDIIKATHEGLGFPVDYSAAAVLWATATSIGNSVHISPRNEWVEPAIVYMALVGKAGANKSHPLQYFIKPLQNADSNNYKRYESQLVEYNDLIKADKGGTSITPAPVKPHWQKSIVSDFTIEALHTVHKHNPRGLGVYCDELMGWIGNFNKYSNGSDTEFWLSNWSAKSITVDRKGDTPILISKPFISVIGTIQPKVLPELNKGSNAYNGFIDRVLFVVPENVKSIMLSDIELDTKHTEQWSCIIDRLLNIDLAIENNIPKPNILRYSQAAAARLRAWQQEYTDKKNEITEDDIAGIYAKVETYVHRFALILQCLYAACDKSALNGVSLQALEGAIKLSEYFTATAIAARGIIDKKNPVDSLDLKKKILYQMLPSQFTTGEAYSICAANGYPERSFHVLLKNDDLFLKLQHGLYAKIA